jgi:hypothetical protein
MNKNPIKAKPKYNSSKCKIYQIKTEIFKALLQTITPDILAMSEHGLKDDEITQCILVG